MHGGCCWSNKTPGLANDMSRSQQKISLEQGKWFTVLCPSTDGFDCPVGWPVRPADICCLAKVYCSEFCFVLKDPEPIVPFLSLSTGTSTAPPDMRPGCPDTSLVTLQRGCNWTICQFTQSARVHSRGESCREELHSSRRAAAPKLESRHSSKHSAHPFGPGPSVHLCNIEKPFN